MGLFTRKQQYHDGPPVPVGQAMCLVGVDGATYIHQQYHPKVTPEAIAQLAATTWVLEQAIESYAAHPDAYDLWMSFVVDSWDPELFNSEHNPTGVHSFTPGRQAAPTEGIAVRGAFALLPTSCLTGSWQATGELDAGGQLRVLGALVEAVDRLGGLLDFAWAAAVMHGMVMEGNVDLRAPRLGESLPQAMMDFGAEHAAKEGQLPSA